jgi:hypothetical protein
MEVSVSFSLSHVIRMNSLQDQEAVKSDGPSIICKQRSIESGFITYMPQAKTSITASEFRLCIIANRTLGSGEIIVAQASGKIGQFSMIALNKPWVNTKEDHLRVFS